MDGLGHDLGEESEQMQGGSQSGPAAKALRKGKSQSQSESQNPRRYLVGKSSFELKRHLDLGAGHVESANSGRG